MEVYRDKASEEESYPVSSDVNFSGEPVSHRTEGPPDVPGLYHLHQVSDDLATENNNNKHNFYDPLLRRPTSPLDNTHYCREI